VKTYTVDVNRSRNPKSAHKAQVGQTGLFSSYVFHMKTYAVDVNRSRNPESAPIAQVGQTGLFSSYVFPMKTYAVEVNTSRFCAGGSQVGSDTLTLATSHLWKEVVDPRHGPRHSYRVPCLASSRGESSLRRQGITNGRSAGRHDGGRQLPSKGEEWPG
jgi:hypothetical protein